MFKLPDGQFIETVLMKYEKRRTLCISTQAGCAMGCVFCATGQMGFFRHLSVAEIVAQVLYFAHELAQSGDHVTNIVLMGMGEPLHNYENTLTAVDRLTAADAFNLGARKITISTVGLVPAMRRYADEQRQTPWPSPSTPPPMKSATSSSRSTNAGPSPMCWTPAAMSWRKRDGASPLSGRSSTAKTTPSTRRKPWAN
ncbi:MAG: radical SAM protein [Chloroflexi bacterium]|nr:radical SAM protein [Chloroflexota bacterium]